MPDRVPGTTEGEGVGNPGPNIPEQDADYRQGGAPAGPLPTEAELPVRSVTGTPARYGGFRPSPETHPLHTPGKPPEQDADC